MKDWISQSFEEIRSNVTVFDDHGGSEFYGLFKNGPSIDAFEGSRKANPQQDDKSTILILSRLDAVITSIIDGYQLYGQSVENEDGNEDHERKETGDIRERVDLSNGIGMIVAPGSSKNLDVSPANTCQMKSNRGVGNQSNQS